LKVPKEGVEEFKDLYLQKYSILLSDEEAYRHFSDLLILFKIIYKPIPADGQELDSGNM